ncbi:Protein N-acetyltransferase [Commensalibacter communis]|uniref:GNAT family N-acetyltransferase n=1 Tax=Commensalibacter communis TaxID=2972786 RepID=UPI0022FF7520|nr:GNAT family protein [Commensalibacter communis]CAI3931127.1 Protein N-acetyltransferase [Commensalibacter communis]
MSYFNELNQAVGEPLPDWKPRPLPQRVMLRGRTCCLEPLSLDHAEALYAAYQLFSDDGHWTWLPREPDKTIEEYKRWVASVITLNDPLLFAIIDNKSNQPVGTFSLMHIDPENGTIEVGHVHYSPLLEKTIMATEAQWLLMNYAFETLGYRRYEWKCNSCNEPSRKAALRLGFQYEGRFRQAAVVKGHNRDTDWFSIIDKEWPAINQAFQHWLSPDNFDQDGKQKQSLQACRM